MDFSSVFQEVNSFRRSLCAIAACLTAVSAAPAQADITVGIAGSLTGPSAFSGEKQEIGAQAAIDNINEAGGIGGEMLTPVFVDDACDPEQAQAAAHQLVSAGAVFVVGHNCSGATIAAMGIYEDAGAGTLFTFGVDARELPAA